MEQILKELGFTEGEIKVYRALIKLQKSTITNIIKESGVSSSKVYIILDKLIEKGLVSYIHVNKIKEFHLTKPINLLENLKKEKERLEEVEKKTKKLVADIDKNLDQFQKEEAHFYRGVLGVKTAHLNLINELKEHEEYVFFSVQKESLEKKEIQIMFQSLQHLRKSKKIRSRGIADPKLKKIFKKNFFINKDYNIHFHPLTLNQGITIGKNRVIIENISDKPFAIEIVSKQVAKSYKDFFEKLWKLTK